jgi:hypothetical protein
MFILVILFCANTSADSCEVFINNKAFVTKEACLDQASVDGVLAIPGARVYCFEKDGESA